jgi:hypothetical protein
MAFEIIKGFYTIKTTVHGFACSGSKLADKLCAMRIATGALNGFFHKHFFAKLLFRIWWGYAVFF